MSFLGLLQLGGALTVILITVLHLHDTDAPSTCLLGTAPNANLCILAYAAGGASAIVSALVGLLLCITARCFGFGHVIDFILGMLGAALWAVVGTIFLYSTRDANAAGVPADNWRFAVWLTSYITCGLFLLSALLSAFLACSACCGRHRNRRSGTGDDVKVVQYGEAAHHGKRRGGCCGGKGKRGPATRDIEAGTLDVHQPHRHPGAAEPYREPALGPLPQQQFISDRRVM